MSYDPFVAQLGSLCRADATRAKWVIVPTHAMGLAIGDRLALSGTDWVNLRFTTPSKLAVAVAAPHLLAAGLDPAPEGLGPSLVMQLLLRLPVGAGSYFRPMADQPRMGGALWSALRELRLGDISSARLSSHAFEDPRKHAELQALLVAYEEFLAEKHQADSADVFRTAAAHARTDSPIATDDLVLESAELGALPILVRAFLDALPGRHIAPAVARVPGLDVPRRLANRPRDPQPTDSRLSYLLAPANAPPPADGQRIGLFHAAGREAEVEAVLRRILGASPAVPLDRIEVACASCDSAHLIWEKLQRLELPVTVEAGIPITATRPARALLGFCEWADGGFAASHLRRLFLSGDIRIEYPDGAGGGRAARSLVGAGATWGRETYERSLKALAARDRAAAAEDGERDADEKAGLIRAAEQAEFLAGWVADLLDRIPRADASNTTALRDVVNGFLAILDECVTATSQLDTAAATAIRDGLGELLALDAFRCPLPQAVAFVRDAVLRRSVGSSHAKPGHLHVSTLASAGCSGRPFTFVVGLQEGGVFPSRVEDPVLLDSERVTLSDSLPTSLDRLTEGVHAAISRLAVLPVPADPAVGAVWLSYSCRDLRDARETAPSWLMLQAARLETGQPDLTYERLRDALGAPETLVAPVADLALTDSGWWLARLKAAGAGGRRAVLDAFPSLAAGRAASEARATSAFTEWDGFVPAARTLLDPRVSAKPVSATRLERFAECPFRYFVEHGLGIEVVDQDPGQDEWLDPLQRGSVLHAIFATLGREARSAGRRLDPPLDTSRARQLADETLAALRQELPPPSDLVFEHERAELLRDVDLFVEFESQRPPSVPVAFEVGFGVPEDGEEPLAQADPVAIPLGKGEHFLLRGKIDRIDRLPDGTYEVIDYKTGRFDRAKWQGTFRGGGMLQHALYGIAATVLLRRLEPKPSVARGVYEFPSGRGGGERVEKQPPSPAALATVLSDLFDVMARGGFVSAHDNAACRSCDFTRACGMPLEASKSKLGNEDNEALEPLTRLRHHD
jgi:RecB family exonuclease